jgi:hypothetical protein
VTNDPLAARGIPSDLKSYLCVEVFEREMPILYVTRPDGEWCFLCGGDHPEDASAYRVVGIGHAIAMDPSLAEVVDLQPNEEAERTDVGGTWTRASF